MPHDFLRGTSAAGHGRFGPLDPLMAQLDWHFTPLPDGALSDSPLSHFPDQDWLGAEALTRAVIQNSLDAALDPNRPVTVRFSEASVDPGVLHSVLKSAAPHFTACDVKLDTFLKTPQRALAIEDFNTTGQTGPIDSRNHKSGSFAAFWQNWGNSAKVGNESGRHGLGKATLFIASELHAAFGWTHRSEDGRLCLMGRAVLDTHHVKGCPYSPFGTFSPGLTRKAYGPVLDEDAVAVGLALGMSQRRIREPGFSLAVLCPSEGYSLAEIRKAVLRHFFYHIATRQLIVEVAGAAIDARSIRQEIEGQQDLAQYRPLIGLIEAESAGIATFRSKGDAEVGNLTAAHFEQNDVVQMRRLWNEGQALRIVLSVPCRARKSETTEIGEVKILLQRADNRRPAEQAFARAGVLLNRIESRAKHALAIVVVEPGPASAFFATAEPAAHTHWVLNWLTREYLDAEPAWRMIRDCVADLERICEPGALRTPLDDFFTAPRIS